MVFDICYFLLLVSLVLVPTATTPSANKSSTISTQPSPSPYCTSDDHCTGSTSRCFAGQCICDMGYVRTHGYCLEFECKSDSECSAHFPHSICSDGSCHCASGHYRHPQRETCVEIAEIEIIPCSADDSESSNCEMLLGTPGSVCYQGECRCPLDYRRSGNAYGNVVGCEQIQCQRNTHCTAVHRNTMCNSAGRCECDQSYNFRLDPKRQFCVLTEDDEDGGDLGGNSHSTASIAALPIGLAVLCALCLAIFTVGLKHRSLVQRRELQRRRLCDEDEDEDDLSNNYNYHQEGTIFTLVSRMPPPPPPYTAAAAAAEAISTQTTTTEFIDLPPSPPPPPPYSEVGIVQQPVVQVEEVVEK